MTNVIKWEFVFLNFKKTCFDLVTNKNAKSCFMKTHFEKMKILICMPENDLPTSETAVQSD